MGAPGHNHSIPAPGYSVAVLHKACGLSYVAGAPRHKHRGAVFELQKEGGETNFMPVLDGEQVPVGEGPRTPPLLQMGDRRPRGRDRLQGTQWIGDPAQAELVPLPWLCMSGCASSSPLWGSGCCPGLLCYSGEQTDLECPKFGGPGRAGAEV